MSLADRLAQVRRDRTPIIEDQSSATARPSAGGIPVRRGARHGTVDVHADLKRQVHQSLLDTLGPKLYDARLTQSEMETKVRTTLHEVLATGDIPLTGTDRAQIAQEISDDILGYGPIEPYLRDVDVTEIMVNGSDQIFVERGGKLFPVDGRFADEPHLRRTIDKIVGRVGRRVDESSPMVDARLPDGSRVNAIIPPLAVDGSLLTIRKFSTDPLTADDLVAFGTMTRVVSDFLAACVRGRLNILVSGGTGAGKTTTLNVLSGFIPEDERVITIEDAAELQLHQEHVLRLEARPANIEGKGEVRIRDLVRNALRMRPDRIVVGEIRDAAALDMLQAMNTGHDGSVGTVHANGPRDVLSRVETMVLMAGVELPVRAIREQVASAIDLIVHQARFKDGTRRITHVTEVVGMEGDVITLQDLFVFDHQMGMDDGGRTLGTLKSTGLRPRFLDKLEAVGVRLDQQSFAFERFGR
ncbi:MAG TPA: CpaF family protein [Kineosporiaceae bacterium]|nr:CpaF family protein [Kineosporiaceae bacterium]